MYVIRRKGCDSDLIILGSLKPSLCCKFLQQKHCAKGTQDPDSNVKLGIRKFCPKFLLT